MPDPTAAPQRRPACYRNAVAYVRGRTQVRLDDLIATLALDAETAVIFLTCMRAEGVIGAQEIDGGWPVCAVPGPSPPEADPVALDALVDRLERAVQAAQRNADALRDRALAAERRLAQQEDRRHATAVANGDERLAAVKRLLARELHPDQPGTPAERSLREAMFKRLWPKLEAIERGTAARPG